MIRAPWLFPAGLMLLLLPFLSVVAFPSQDGPAHLDTARLLFLLDREAPVASSIYVRNDPGIPQQLAPWLLSLLRSALEPKVAEWALNLLLTLFLASGVILPLYLLNLPKYWGLVGLPLAAPFMLYMGSISLCLSYGFVYWALTVGVAYLRRPTALLLALFAGLNLLAFLAHPQSVPLIVAVSAGGVAGTLGWRFFRGGLREARRRLLSLGAALLPALAALLIYQAAFPRETISQGAKWDFLVTIGRIVVRREIAHFSLLDRILLIGIFLALCLAGAAWLKQLWGKTSVDVTSEWSLFGAISCFISVLILPEEAGVTSQIPQRMLPAAHFMLYLWLLSALPAVRFQEIILWFSAIFMVTSGLGRTLAHVRMATDIDRLIRVEESIPSGSVVVPFDLARISGAPSALERQGGVRLGFWPLYHNGRGYGMRDLASLGNYQALGPFFRIQYRSPWSVEVYNSQLYKGEVEFNEFVMERPSQEALAAVFDQFEASFGQRITHVILMTGGLDPDAIGASNASVKAVLGLLQDRFEQVSSSDKAVALLWARRRL